MLERLGKKRRYTKEEWRGRLINCVYIRARIRARAHAHACWCSDPKTGLQVALCVIRGGMRFLGTLHYPRSLDSFCTQVEHWEATWVPPISSPYFLTPVAPGTLALLADCASGLAFPAHHHCLFLFLRLSVRPASCPLRLLLWPFYFLFPFNQFLALFLEWFCQNAHVPVSWWSFPSSALLSVLNRLELTSWAWRGTRQQVLLWLTPVRSVCSSQPQSCALCSYFMHVYVLSLSVPLPMMCPTASAAQFVSSGLSSRSTGIPGPSKSVLCVCETVSVS